MNIYKTYIKEHFFALCVSLGVWLASLFWGMFSAFTADKAFANDVDSYIQSILSGQSGYFAVLGNGVANNFWHTFVLCVASSFVILLPCILFLIAFKGFATGFAATFIIRLYALKGVAATVTAVVLPLCFSLPVFLIMYISSLEFPLQTFRLRKEISSSQRWKMYLSHVVKMLVLFAVLSLITSIEAFLSPKLFKVLVK